MEIRKEYLSNVVYWLALILLVGAGADVIFSFREFIFSGKGIGVYGSLIYYAAAFISIILWGASYLIYKKKEQAAIFWLIFILLTVFVATQPTWWAAP